MTFPCLPVPEAPGLFAKTGKEEDRKRENIYDGVSLLATAIEFKDVEEMSGAFSKISGTVFYAFGKWVEDYKGLDLIIFISPGVYRVSSFIAL